MGGGPIVPVLHHEPHLLITLPMTEPTSILSALRRAHPNLHITYLDLKTCPTVPAGLYASATILATLFTLPADPQKQAPRLKWVHIFAAGVGWITRQPLYKDTDVAITTSSGAHGPQIAEWALMTRLVQSHGYNALHDAQKEKEWNGALAFQTDDLTAKRVGILGYGSIGRQVARLAVAAGMHVVAYTASEKRTPGQKRDAGFVVPGTGDVEGTLPSQWFSGTTKEDLHRFLGAQLDWLVIAAPLTDKTRGLLGSDEFDVLSRRKAFITNIARGAIIRQDELVDALRAGRLRGAALDVTDPEPLPKESPLWQMDNVTITPHISGASKESTVRCFQILHENANRWERHEDLINEVSRRKGY